MISDNISNSALKIAIAVEAKGKITRLLNEIKEESDPYSVANKFEECARIIRKMADTIGQIPNEDD